MVLRARTDLVASVTSDPAVAKNREISSLWNLHQPLLSLAIGIKILPKLSAKLAGGYADDVLVSGIIVDGAPKDMVANELFVNFFGATVQGTITDISEKVAKPGRFLKNRTRQNAPHKRTKFVARRALIPWK